MEMHSNQVNVPNSESPDWGQEDPMNTSPVPSEEHTLDAANGSSLAQSIGGLAAIILAIVGLAHVLPHYMVAIGALVIGAAFIFQGGNTFVEFSTLLPRQSGGRSGNSTVGSSVGTEVLAGVAGIVLGILALVTATPDVLLPIAVIVFGAALILTSGDVSRVNALRLERAAGDDTAHQVARQSFSTGGGTQVFIGLTSVVLGIIGLIGYDWAVLSLVALLVIGVSVLISSTALVDKMMTFVQG
jgi:hypothetical protein